MPTHFPPDLDPASSSALKDADVLAGLRHLLAARRRRKDIKGETVDQLGLPEAEETDGADVADDGPEAPRTWRPDVRL